MSNKYPNAIIMKKEDMSYSEVNWCWEYANQVVCYCNENGIDLSNASDAERAVVRYSKEQRSFAALYGYELSDYLETVVADIGMIVEQY